MPIETNTFHIHKRPILAIRIIQSLQEKVKSRYSHLRSSQ